MTILRCWILLSALLAPSLHAETVPVAVAANFAATASALADGFERRSGHRALVAAGATGKLYAQIRAGAPFAVFLSADAATVSRLLAEQRAVAGTQRTYAVGALVLWSARADFVDAEGRVLQAGQFRHLAVANPRTAPYGAAAAEVLRRLNLEQALAPRQVMGENIAQTHQFVASGNAELGFVAKAQVWRDGRIASGSGWLVPPAWHAPLRQDAVLLLPGANSAAARAFLDYLGSAEARAVIVAAGYTLP